VNAAPYWSGFDGRGADASVVSAGRYHSTMLFGSVPHNAGSRMWVLRIGRVNFMRRMNRGQRVALLVALGSIALALDAALGPSMADEGWFGYAPNTSIVYSPESPWLRFGVRFVLVSLWTAAAIALLRSTEDD
jgi:hypothetical protein